MTKIRIMDAHYLYVDGRFISPEKSLKVYNHSPTGFSFGYDGSGPAQAALAILLEVTDRKTALALYQKFKWYFVSGWKDPDMEVEIDIIKWIKEQKENIADCKIKIII